MKKYKTNLSIDDCKKRLNDKLNQFVSQNYFKNSYIGKIKNNKFRFYYHEANKKNRLNIAVHGKFSNENQETILTLHYTSTLISLSYYLFFLILLTLVFISRVLFLDLSWDFPLFIQGYLTLSISSTIIGLLSLNTKKNRDRRVIIETFLKKELNLKNAE